MAFTPGSGAVIAVGVDGAAASKRDIDSIADSLRRLNDGNFQKLSGQMTALQGHVGGLKNAFQAIAAFSVAGFGAGAFIGMIQGSIDALDSLNDLSKTTGITVANLAGLKLAAHQSGGDLEGIAASINKLSVAIGKDADRFKQLGVTAKDPLEAFKQFSDVFSAIEDPQTRAALGAEALGKSWASAAPLLMEGGKKIGEMVEKGKVLSGATQEMADKADAFNDKMAELSVAAEGAKLKIVGSMLPGLVEATAAITYAYEESGKLTAAWVALGAVGAFMFTDQFSSAQVQIKNLEKEIDDLLISKNIVSGPGGLLLHKLLGTPAEFDARIDAARSKLKGLEDTLAAPKKAVEDAAAKAKADKEAADAKRRAEEFIKLGETERKKAEAEYAASIKTAKDYIATLKVEESQIGATSEQIKMMTAARAAEKAPTAALRKQIMDEALALHVDAKAWAEKAAAEKAAADLQKRFDDSAESVWDQVRALEAQIETYGMLGSAVIELQKTKVMAKLQSVELSADETTALESELAGLTRLASAKRNIEGMDAVKKSLADLAAETRHFSDVVDQSLTDGLMRGFENGKSIAENFIDTVQNMFATLVLRPVVQGVVQSGLSMGANALGMAGSAGNAGSGASSLLSSVGTAGSLYSAYTSSSLGQFMSGYSGSAGAASEMLGGAPLTASAQYGQMASNGLSGVGGAGAAASWLAAAYIGRSLGNSISAGDSVSGGNGGGFVNFSTLASPVPILGGISGGLINRAFGSGAEEATRLGFGSNNAAGAISINERGNEGKTDKYVAGTSSDGAFGSFGVVSTFWMEAAQPAVQSFVKSITQTDDALAQFINSTEKATAIAALSGHTMTSNSGAEGSDPNGLGGLDAVFADRIHTIFQAIDPALNALLDNFKGTSQELSVEATALLDYRKNLPAASTAVFGAVVTLQQLAALRTPTELISTALVRVTNAFTSTNRIIETLGVSAETAFGAVGIASLETRQRLVDLAGGLDAIASGASYFSENFLSAEERLAPVIDSVCRRMDDLGYAGVTTAAGYKDAVVDLVKSGKLASEEGSKTYVELLKLGPAFKLIGDSVGETVTGVASKARDALSRAYERERDDIQATIDKMGNYATSLRNFRDGLTLGSLSPLSPEQKYAEATAQFQQTLAAARAGDVTAQGKLENIATSFLTASQMANASDGKYQADFALVQQATSSMEAWASTQVDVGQASLTALEQQVSGLIDINSSINAGTLSVTQAIDALTLAMGGVPVIAGALPLNGSHAAGLAYVPFDGYRAELHKGEQVLTAREANDYRGMGRLDMAPLVAEIKALREEVKTLRGEQKEQTGALIAGNYGAAERNGDKVVQSNVETARSVQWAATLAARAVLA